MINGLFIFLFSILFYPNSYAQIMVPDSNFRAVLVDNYGITFDENNKIANQNIAEEVLILNIANHSISDLTGIEAFTSLNKLYCFSNQLTSLDLSANTEITDLDCSNNLLTSLDVSSINSLNKLNCFSNQLTSLDVSANTEITYLDCSNNQLTGLDISANTALTSLYCNSNQLTSLDVSSNNALINLNCYSNQLTSLDFSSNSTLTDLDCSNNQITNLNVAEAISLNKLYCFTNQLTSLDVSANTELTNLQCSNNQLTSLDVSLNTGLITLYCSLNQLISLDVSTNTGLKFLKCSFNQLTSLDVSANTTLNLLYISGNITPFTLGVWTESFPPQIFSGFNDTDPASVKVFGALPVELISFTANGNQLSWKTATETNNAGWEVEIRITGTKDKGTWRKIGFVAGKGTTSEAQSYSFSVLSSEFKVPNLLVRLKQIDSDGKFSYSKVLTVNLTIKTYLLSQNYPNPFNPKTTISYKLSANSYVELKVYDLLGREMKTLVSEKKPAGIYHVDFNATNLPSGVYIYKLITGNFTETRKMTVMK